MPALRRDVSTILSLPTEYQGVTFRSRTEARWAVFFETVGIRWEYEKEGFDLGGRWYLPDFWLPEHEMWIEIKGSDPGGWSEAGKLCSALAEVTRSECWLAWDTPQMPLQDEWAFKNRRFEWYKHGGFGDQDYHWCQCLGCGLLGVEHEGKSERLPCSCEWPEKTRTPDTWLLAAAYEIAAQAFRGPNWRRSA